MKVGGGCSCSELILAVTTGTPPNRDPTASSARDREVVIDFAFALRVVCTFWRTWGTELGLT